MVTLMLDGGYILIHSLRKREMDRNEVTSSHGISKLQISNSIFPLNLIISRVDQISPWNTNNVNTYHVSVTVLSSFYSVWTELCPP